MQKTITPLQVALLLLAGACLVLLRIDEVWSASVDLAHHYALVFRLSEDWRLVPDDPSLGEMNIYPRTSHIIAAILGKLFGSPLLGMQVLALGSLALLWGTYLYILHTLPWRQALLGSLALVGLIYLNDRYVHLALHGAELVGNFFFSQIVGQALALLAIAVAIRLEATRSRWHAVLWLMAAVYLITGVHLLPALELLGVLAGVLLIDCASATGTRRQRLQGAALSAVLLGVSIAGVLVNPVFAAMRLIAENNGGLQVPHLDSKLSIAALCLLVLAAALAMLYRWYRNNAAAGFAAYKYLGMYGAAMAALCLLQMGMLLLHQGSEYAVKKYLFGLCSFLAVALAIALGAICQRLLARVDGGNVLVLRALQTVVLLGTLYVAVERAPHPAKLLDASVVTGLERQLTALRDTVLAPSAPGKHAVIIDLAGQPPTVNYMFSIAIARTPREVAVPDLLVANNVTKFDAYSAIISSPGTSRYAGARCVTGTSAALLVSDVACARQFVADSKVCRGTLDFSLAGRVDASMLTGFSGAEQDFRWTDGKRATITCRVDQAFRTAKISLAAFIQAPLLRQRVAIAVNDAAPASYVFDQARTSQELAIALPAMVAGADLTFTLDLPDAAAPTVLGISADKRELGAAVRTLKFE